MRAVMKSKEACGIAAPQIGKSERVFLIEGIMELILSVLYFSCLRGLRGLREGNLLLVECSVPLRSGNPSLSLRLLFRSEIK
tara:strand:- start:850 stop:1095 length:246 start_codon:yes stop_codon:yes gene_type:complete